MILVVFIRQSTASEQTLFCLLCSHAVCQGIYSRLAGYLTVCYLLHNYVVSDVNEKWFRWKLFLVVLKVMSRHWPEMPENVFRHDVYRQNMLKARKVTNLICKHCSILFNITKMTHNTNTTVYLWWLCQTDVTLIEDMQQHAQTCSAKSHDNVM
jgi:hypothetical protein